MLQKKYLILVSLATATLFFTACTSTTAPQPIPVEVIKPKVVTEQRPVAQNEEAIDLSQKSETFHSGMTAGCSTAKGKYSKDSARFSGEADYKEGWFYGRRKCQAHKAV